MSTYPTSLISFPGRRILYDGLEFFSRDRIPDCLSSKTRFHFFRSPTGFMVRAVSGKEGVVKYRHQRLRVTHYYRHLIFDRRRRLRAFLRPRYC